MTEIYVGGVSGKSTHHMIKAGQVLTIEGSRNTVTVKKLGGQINLAGNSNTIVIEATEGDPMVIKKSATGTIIKSPGVQFREFYRPEEGNAEPRTYRVGGNQQQYNPYEPGFNQGQHPYDPYQSPNQHPNREVGYNPYPPASPGQFNPLGPTEIDGLHGNFGMGRDTLLEVARNNPENVGVMAPNAAYSRILAQNLDLRPPGQPGAGNAQPPAPVVPRGPSNYTQGSNQTAVGPRQNYTPVNIQSGIPPPSAGFGNNRPANYTPAIPQSGVQLQPQGPGAPNADDLV